MQAGKSNSSSSRSNLIIYGLIAFGTFLLTLLVVHPNPSKMISNGMSTSTSSGLYTEMEISTLFEKVKDLEEELERVKKPGLHRPKSPPNIPGKPDPNLVAKTDKLRGAEGVGYGGKGDNPHLGGFVANDTQGQSPALWNYFIKAMTIKSFLDVGCGRGISSKFMLDRGLDVLCVEGSHDAVQKSLLPRDKIVEHDIYQGPWWPERTYDIAWSVEVLEHIGRHKMQNYIETFKSAACIFVTHSLWGGWHHVEVHPDGHFFRNRLTAQGFVYMPEFTAHLRKIAGNHISMEDGFSAQHLWLSGEFYINPAVASLPEHRHLFGGPGCYPGSAETLPDGTKLQVLLPCDGLDELPEEFLPINVDETKYDVDPESRHFKRKDTSYHLRRESTKKKQEEGGEGSK